MRKIFLLIALFVSYTCSSQFVNFISRNNAGDTSYGTHYDTLQRGGYQVVTNKTQRNAIPYALRKQGMWVKTAVDDSVFNWTGSAWQAVVFSGTSFQATSTGIIGDIYNKSVFPNLSDFATNAGFTASSNKINATASDNSYGNYLRLNYATALDNYNLSATYKYTASAASDSGLRVTLWGSGTSCGVYLNPITRRVTGYMSYGFTKYFSEEQLPSISTGDSLKVSLSWVRGLIITTATNFTTGNTIIDTLPSLFLSGASTISGIVSNTAYPTIYAGNSSYQICSFRYSSGEFSNVPLVALGNSITRTSYPTSAAGRYGEQIGAVIWAAPGDGTTEVLERLPEFRDYIKGKNVTMMIGGNDLAGSLSDTANFKIRYQRIVDSLTSYGVLNIIHLLPTPRTGYPNIFWLQGWLKLAYPTTYIDTYAALLGSGTDMNSIYNSGDNVHPNQLGHDKIANTIISSPLYQSLVNSYGFNQVLQKYSTGSITNDTALATLGTVKTLLQNVTTSSAGGGTAISGTPNAIAKFNSDGTNLENSNITQSGSDINVAGNAILTGFLKVQGVGQLSSGTRGQVALNYNTGLGGGLYAYNQWVQEIMTLDSTGKLTILNDFVGRDVIVSTVDANRAKFAQSIIEDGYNITANDFSLITSPSSAINIFLPLASNKTIYILKNAGTAICYINSAGGQVIGNSGSAIQYALMPGESVILQAGASSYKILLSQNFTNPLTTTGDIIYSSSGSTAARLPIGTSNQVLTVSGGVPTWQTPTSTGATIVAQGVSQSVSGITTDATITSYTTPNNGTVHSYRVGSDIKINNLNGSSVKLRVSFTDVDGASVMQDFYTMGSSTSTLTTGYSAMPSITITAAENTTITVQLVFTATVGSVIHFAHGTIEDLGVVFAP